MAEREKPPLRDLLKSRPAPKKGRTKVGARAIIQTQPLPKIEGPINIPKVENIELESEDVDVSELESPAPQKIPEAHEPSLHRIRNRAIAANIIKLFSCIRTKNETIKSMFNDLIPRIDASNNLVISGREVGHVFRNENGGMYVRIYLDRLKLRGTDEKNMIGETFTAFSKGKYKFFNVDEYGTTFGFSEKEGGKPILQNLAVEVQGP